MTPQDVCKDGLAKYNSNPYMRLIHAARHATLDAAGKVHWRPRHVVVRLVGTPGVGKTAIVEDYCRREAIGYVKIDAQVTDIAEVFGLKHVKDGSTSTALPDWWPKDGTHGVVNLDDMSRALPHIQQSLQQFVLERAFNGSKIPDTWSIVITDNPDDGKNNVTSLDAAQASRMITVPYNVSRDVEVEQMFLQEVDDDLKNFWVANQDALKTERVKLELPDNNPRMRMIFARIYPYIKGDPLLLDMVGSATFGTEFLASIKAFLNSEQPISPADILEGKDFRVAVDRWIRGGYNSLISASVYKLLMHLKTIDAISKDQFDRVAAFLCTVPAESGSLAVFAMVDGDTAFGKRYQSLVLSHPGLLATYKAKLMRVRSELGR